MGLRDEYKVHPAADVFPMMSDDELKALGEDIKANGQTIPVLFWNGDGKGAILIDGRNRLEALERIGMADQALTETFICKDPATHISSDNVLHVDQCRVLDPFPKHVPVAVDELPERVAKDTEQVAPLVIRSEYGMIVPLPSIHVAVCVPVLLS